LDSNSGNIYWKDLLLFIVFPLIFAGTLSYVGFSIKPFIGNLIAAIAIFGGFLFNLLAIVYSQIDKIKTDAETENSGIKKRFVKEIHINISYSIVLSILIVAVLICSTIVLPSFQYDWIIKKIVLGLIYFSLFHFFLTLLMILNRVYILLKRETN
jgi:hypothetical protein